jgi:DNA mismatch repair protein MutL
MKKLFMPFVQAAVKHALAQFSVTPALDFDLDSSIQQLSSIQQPFTEERKSQPLLLQFLKALQKNTRLISLNREKKRN